MVMACYFFMTLTRSLMTAESMGSDAGGIRR